MKKVLKMVIVILLIACVVGGGFLVYKRFLTKERGITITSWDSLYNESNVKFFYEDLKAENTDSDLKKLDTEYKIKDSIKGLTTEKDIIDKSIDTLNSIADYDDIKETKLTSGFAIIANMAGRKKLAARDMAILHRDILLTEGVTARVGEFRKEDPKNQKNPSYYVVEYWSTKQNKWVMIDSVNGGHLEKNNEMLSSIEVLQAKINDLTYVGGKISQSEFKSNIKKYLSSYTIAIDNTLKKQHSNTYLTYTTNKKDITVQIGDRYSPSTIYTANKDLYQVNPSKSQNAKDTKAYLVMMKNSDEGAADNAYILGAFKDGSILDQYYLKINDDTMEKVAKYKYVEFAEGETTISLLVDGQSVDAKAVIQNNK